MDGDTGTAFAWIAAGRFEPAVVPLPTVNPNQVSARVQAAAEMARTLQLTALVPEMGRFVASDVVDVDAQAALATALVALEPGEQRIALAPLLGDGTVPAGVAAKDRKDSGGRAQRELALDVLVEAMRSVPSRLQLKVAQSLAGSAAGAETLFNMVEKRQAAPQLLLDRGVQDKLNALNSSELKTRHAKLIENLEPPNEAIQKLIEAKRAAYNPRRASRSRARRYSRKAARSAIKSTETAR